MLQGVIDFLRGELGRLPHDRDSLLHLLHRAELANPGIVIVAALLVLVVLAFIRRHGRRSAALAIAVCGVSFFLFPAGRTVLGRAMAAQGKEKVLCIGEAIVNGAVWKTNRIKEAHACDKPLSAHVAASRTKIDSGSDGTLTGRVDGPGWTAEARAVAQHRSWKALSVDDAGSWSTFLQEDTVFYRVSGCPDDQGNAPRNVSRDTTGVRYSAYFASHVQPRAFPLIVPGAAARAPVAAGGTRGVYRFRSRTGATVAFLLPVQGDRGYCAILNGPYRRVRGGFALSRATRAGSRALESLAMTTRVAGLRNN
jgi:hypothetical protein